MKRTFLLSAFAIVVTASSLSAQTNPVVIRAGSLIDGKGGMQTNVAIVVQDSKIVRIEPARAGVTYDLSTQTVMPGLIDTHTHIFDHFNRSNGRLHTANEPETLEQTQGMIERVQARWADFGYSWWSFIELATGDVVGAGCIQNLRRGDSPLPDRSCPLEIGWRLRRDRWHQGLATEAAHAMSAFAFDELNATELFAVCDPDNAASASVMRRLGMDSLGLDTWYGHALATYRIAADAWRARRAAADLG